MRIDNDAALNAERSSENAICRLAPHAGQLQKFFHRLRNRTAELFHNCLCRTDNVFCFVVVKAGGFNVHLQFMSSACAKYFTVGYFAKSAGVTIFTLTSVHCAERMVDIKSSNGLENCSAVLASGNSFFNCLRISFSRSPFFS